MIRIGGTEFSLPHRAFEIYFAGCLKPRCPGCHNPELWDFRHGWTLTDSYGDWIIEKIKDNDLIENVWLLGGEPLDQDQLELVGFLLDIKRECHPIDLWLFTKRSLDEVPMNYLRLCSYIKCGRYEENNRSDHTEHGVVLASANQHIHKRGVDYMVLNKDEQQI